MKTSNTSQQVAKLEDVSAKTRRSMRPRGPLHPMAVSAASSSYTQPKTNTTELNLSTEHMLELNEIIKFNSRDTPQPFLDPSILQKQGGQQSGWQKQNVDETMSRRS